MKEEKTKQIISNMNLDNVFQLFQNHKEDYFSNRAQQLSKWKEIKKECGLQDISDEDVIKNIKMVKSNKYGKNNKKSLDR
ncbi:MAG: hypothetical protein ACOCQR_01480 [bacterium]